MGWIHAGNSDDSGDGGAFYAVKATAVIYIKNTFNVDDDTAWAAVAVFVSSNQTLASQMSDDDYIRDWLEFPLFIRFVEIFRKYRWIKKVNDFLYDWVFRDLPFEDLVSQVFPEFSTPAPVDAQPKWVDYLALYEAKYGINLHDKANDGDWYMDVVYPLSLNDWAQVQLEAVSF